MALPNQKEPDETDEIQEPADDKPVKREPTVTANAEDGTVKVDLGEEEKPEGQETRRARRGGRQADEVARYRAEAEAARTEVARLRAETQAQLGMINQRLQQPPADPFKQRISNIRAEQETIQLAMRTTQMSEAELQTKRQRFYELNDEADDLRDQRTLERASQVARQAAQQPAGAGEEAIIRSEFPDVIGHPQAMAWAHGRYNQLVAEGEPRTLVTSRKALTEAAENPRFAIRRPVAPRPTEAQQARYGALPAQAGVRGGGGEINLTPQQMKMAVARWPELAAMDENKAYIRAAKLFQNIDRE